MLKDDDSLMLHQEWIAEIVKRGVFMTNHHNHFMNASLTDEDIKQTIDIAEEASTFFAKITPSSVNQPRNTAARPLNEI